MSNGLLCSILFSNDYNLHANTSDNRNWGNHSFPATYLQPQSLRYHSYVGTDKYYSPGVIKVCHDEGSAVEAHQKPTTHLFWVRISHLEGKSSIKPTQPKYWATYSFACIFLSRFARGSVVSYYVWTLGAATVLPCDCKNHWIIEWFESEGTLKII